MLCAPCGNTFAVYRWTSGNACCPNRVIKLFIQQFVGAPRPQVDGFSIGAVMGYSQQHTVMALGSDEDVQSLSVSGKRRMKIGAQQC